MKLVGIRLESFDEQNQQFSAPHYLIFRKPKTPKATLTLYKHTLPRCIDVEAFQHRYGSNIYHLVRSIQQQVVLYDRKRAIFNELQQLGAQIDADDNFRLVRLSLNNACYTLVCSANRVERVVENNANWLLGSLWTLKGRIEARL